ncbi:MAG: cytochrome C oxidase subunit IV family protein [Litorilituus sp.]|nr:cytochrome C oxidase subunit IV family protein [Litorilituus sp.]
MSSLFSTKKNTVSWLYLLLLTVISAYSGTFNFFDDNKQVFVLFVLFIVFLKGQKIVDIFMELIEAPKLWRRLLLGYVILLPVIIACIYLL